MPRIVVLLIVMGSLVACGGEDTKKLSVVSKKDGGGDGGGVKGGEPLDGGKEDLPGHRDATVFDSGGGASNDPFAPVVSFVSPDPATDPNDDDVLTGRAVDVVCKAERSPIVGASDVDQTSVRIAVTDADGLVEPMEFPVRVAGADTYEATLTLDGIGNGPVDVTCTADDLKPEAHVGSATLHTLLDLGPSIRVIEPAEGSVHALEQAVAVRFLVSPEPLGSDDDEADIKKVRLSILGVNFPLEEDPTVPGMYAVSVDFGDRTVFPMALDTAQIAVQATNKRTPNAVTRTERINIVLDAEGPSIVVDSPQNLALVRGDVTLNVTVTDPAGVEASSVVADINNGLHTLEKWNVVGDQYSEKFDTRAFGTQLTQLTINIRATDSVGNESTQSHLLRLDNVPPRIDLDPPYVREYRDHMDVNTFECSDAFDPVGDSAANDHDVKTYSSLYRAQIMDEANWSPGSGVTYIAGVDETQVWLFAQDDPSIALLVDTNGDGICDDIQDETLPEAKRPLTVQLSAVTPGGEPLYSAEAGVSDLSRAPFGPPVSGGLCTAGEEDVMMAKPRVCMRSEMTRVTHSITFGEATNSIFAISPEDAAGECTGITWELGTQLAEGWVCLAVRAVDNKGNVGISPPIRVCLDDLNPANGVPSCNPGCVPDLDPYDLLFATCQGDLGSGVPDCSGSPAVSKPCDWSGLGFGSGIHIRQ